MKQISNKEYEKYQQYQTDKLYGRILTPDGLRVVCAGLDKNVTVSWKKIKKTKALRKKIKSIQVQRADNKSFTQNVHSKKVGKTKTKVTFKLKRKKTYYVRVRYVGKGGYSKWSKVRRVKTK